MENLCAKYVVFIFTPARSKFENVIIKVKCSMPQIHIPSFLVSVVCLPRNLFQRSHYVNEPPTVRPFRHLQIKRRVF